MPFCDSNERDLNKMLEGMLEKFSGMVVDTEADNFGSVKTIC